MSELTDEDMRALVRAIDLACLDPAEKASIEARLGAGAKWTHVAVDCARRLQREGLALRPWESPPLYGDIDKPKLDKHAAELLQKLLSLGLSRYEPQPVRALERAERAAKAKAVAP